MSPRGFRKDNSIHIPGHILRMETEFAEAESEEASAQGCRAIPPSAPMPQGPVAQNTVFDQKQSLQELIVPSTFACVI